MRLLRQVYNHRMMGVATNVDVLEADFDLVAEQIRLAVVGHRGGIFG